MTNENIKQVLKAATGAHGMFKTRLFEAIENGDLSQFEAARSGRDDQCAFGKWLHEEILPGMKHSARYAKVLSMHADFHKSVAKALVLAECGKKIDAVASVREAATPLTLELMAWGREVGSDDPTS